MARFYSASNVSFSQRPAGSQWVTALKIVLSCVWAILGVAVPFLHGQERSMCAHMHRAVLIAYLSARTAFNLILSILGTCLYILETSTGLPSQEHPRQMFTAATETTVNTTTMSSPPSTIPYNPAGGRVRRQTGQYEHTAPAPSFLSIQFIEVTFVVVLLSLLFIIVRASLLWCKSYSLVHLMRKTIPLIWPAPPTPPTHQGDAEPEEGAQETPSPEEGTSSPTPAMPAEAPSPPRTSSPTSGIPSWWSAQSGTPSGSQFLPTGPLELDDQLSQWDTERAILRGEISERFRIYEVLAEATTQRLKMLDARQNRLESDCETAKETKYKGGRAEEKGGMDRGGVQNEF